LEEVVDKLHLSDQELVTHFIGGDNSAMEILVKRHKSKVYNYILMVVKNQALAEDIFQDTFIKVIKSLLQGKYCDNGKFVSWVVRIAHNLIIDHFRHEKQLPKVKISSGSVDILNSVKLADNPMEDEMIKSQITSDIRNLINYLPEEQKQVIILRHYVGLSFKEIAEFTDVSINTALGRMRYALINLRKMIEEKEIVLSGV
jgi:RNA polymerase sigma factor (sigma-70 family)